MYLSWDIPKQHSATHDQTYKDPENPFFNFLDPSHTSHSPPMVRGGSDPSGSPKGVPFRTKIENPCENHILWAFCILSRKSFCYSFFGLCLVKNGHFCQFSRKSYFDQIYKRYWKIYSRISVSMSFWTSLVTTYNSLAGERPIGRMAFCNII